MCGLSSIVALYLPPAPRMNTQHTLITLLTSTTTPPPPKLCRYARSRRPPPPPLPGMEAEDENPENDLDTEIYVQVKPRGVEVPAGTEIMWPLDKFMGRLFAMREMFMAFVDAGRTLAGTEWEAKERDPFYDEPAEALIGKCTLYLEPLQFYLHM